MTKKTRYTTKAQRITARYLAPLAAILVVGCGKPDVDDVEALRGRAGLDSPIPVEQASTQAVAEYCAKANHVMQFRAQVEEDAQEVLESAPGPGASMELLDRHLHAINRVQQEQAELAALEGDQMKLLLIFIAIPITLGILETLFVTLRAFLVGGKTKAWKALQGIDSKPPKQRH